MVIFLIELQKESDATHLEIEQSSGKYLDFEGKYGRCEGEFVFVSSFSLECIPMFSLCHCKVYDQICDYSGLMSYI